jgi:hypothetical protein
VLRAISPDATPEEVAAILAAVTQALAASESSDSQCPPGNGESLDEWVRGSRLGARRAGLQRGPWRLSGRIGRRSRA